MANFKLLLEQALEKHKELKHRTDLNNLYDKLNIVWAKYYSNIPIDEFRAIIIRGSKPGNIHDAENFLDELKPKKRSRLKT